MSTKKKIASVIFAAGRSSRFMSSKTKILHHVGGRSIIEHVISAATSVSDEVFVVVSPSFDQTAVTMPVKFVVQHTPIGTADAFSLALNAMQGMGITHVITLMGDSALITYEILQSTLDTDADMVVVGMRPDDTAKYGRIVQSDGIVTKIIEHSSATEEERKNGFCNSGIFSIEYDFAKNVKVQKNPNSGEYQVTDFIEIAANSGKKVVATDCDWRDLIGINTREELATAESIIQNRYRKRAMEAGATLLYPSSVFLSFDTVIGRDVVIHPFVTIGNGVRLCEGAEIFSFSSIRDAVIGAGSSVGPFAAIRDNVTTGQGVSIGSFIETKNSSFGDMSTAKHLSYIGDARIGSDVNIGAGCVTCNYDGHNKHETTIMDGAFIGSNTSIIAPVTIGKNSTVAAGGTITMDVPDGSLAVARAEQRNIKLRDGHKHLNRKRRHKLEGACAAS